MRITRHSLMGAYNPYRYILKEKSGVFNGKTTDKRFVTTYGDKVMIFHGDHVYVVEKDIKKEI